MSRSAAKKRAVRARYELTKRQRRNWGHHKRWQLMVLVDSWLTQAHANATAQLAPVFRFMGLKP